MKIKEIIKSVKLPAKASVFYLGSSIAGKFVSVAVTPFFTRLLNSDEYGEFAEYMSLVGGVTLICSALTSGSAVFKGLRDYKDKKQTYISGVFRANLVFSLIICTLLFAFSPFLGIKRPLLIPLTLQILCDGIVALTLSCSKFNYEYKTVAILTVIGATLPSIISIVVIMIFGGGYQVRIYSLLLVSFCIAVYSLRKILKRGSVNKNDIKYIMKNSLPLLPNGISNALAIQADKLILGAIMGTAALAKYSVVYSLGVAIQFTVTAIGSALSPWIIRRLDLGERTEIRALVFPMLIGYCALSLCLIAVGPEAMLILAPSDYSDAFSALTPIALSTPFLFISFVCTVGIIYSSRSWYSAIISLVSSFICVALNFALIGSLGYLGAGFATLGYHILSAVMGMVVLIKLGLGDILYTRKMLLSCLYSGGLGVLLFILRDNIFARGTVLIIPGTMLLYCLYKAKDLVLEKGAKKLS